jgi:NADPH:quinone reductase-like Zn-dependent oxidoreductase
VIDHTRQDFTQTGQRYDLILDLVAHRSALAYPRALRPGGTYFAVGGSVLTFLQILLFGPLIRGATGKHVRVLVVQPNRKDLLEVTEMCASGKIHLIIDRSYPLKGVPEALRHVGEGRAKGKVVITMDPAGGA